MHPKRIVLLGPMGTGKTTIGRGLADRLGCRYYDNDAELSSRYGMSPAVLAEMPVEQLHDLESRYLREVLCEVPPLVTGVAGSVIDDSDNRELLRSAYCVYLYLPLHEVERRVGDAGVGRQAVIASGKKVLSERFARRDPLYREVAQLELRDRQSPESDIARILSALELAADSDN